MHFDGIRNVGVGIAHDPSATIWANLGSLGSAYDATKKALTSSVPSGAREGEWSDVGYSFKGMEYFALGSAVALGNEVTVQCIVDYDGMNQCCSGRHRPMQMTLLFTDAKDLAPFALNCSGRHPTI